MSRVNLYRSVLNKLYLRNAKLAEEDKFGVYESSTTDSGFISGANLTVSGEIQEATPEEASGVVDNYMRLDSGVDLSESFSGLNLKNPDLNDLSSCTKLKTVQEPPVEVEVAEPDEPWKKYFRQDKDGNTVLHIAIIEGFVEVVLALLRMAPHAQFLDTLNDDAQTPIHLAASMGHWRMVRWLVVAGAKPSLRNIRGDSPLHIAARNGDILSCKAITDPVQEQERRALALSYLQEESYPLVNLDQWNYEGQTCVHVAAIGGHVDVLRHLVWYGADINAREGRQGYTALHYAVERGDERLAHFLLSECKKLNAEVVTYGGNSALQLGYPVPSTIAEALRSRGVPSPFSSSDEEFDESDSENDITYENTSSLFVRNLVDASA